MIRGIEQHIVAKGLKFEQNQQQKVTQSSPDIPQAPQKH